jgi:hypothetical protein
MTHFVGQGEHVPQVTGIIQQNVWMQGRGHAGAKGSPVLSLAGRGIDPAVFEKLPGNPAEERMEPLERFQKKASGFLEGDLLGAGGQRSIKVIVPQLR